MPDFNLDMTNKDPYSDQYINEVFSIWWSHGKIAVSKLHSIIPPDPKTGSIPSIPTLLKWKKNIFLEKAAQLDQEFFDQISEVAIQTKIEMLERHAKTAFEMEEIAIKHIKDNESSLTMQSAIRLLIEGVRIERESRGIPDALQRMSERSDTELLEEVKQILSGSNIELLPPEVE